MAASRSKGAIATIHIGHHFADAPFCVFAMILELFLKDCNSCVKGIHTHNECGMLGKTFCGFAMILELKVVS